MELEIKISSWLLLLSFVFGCQATSTKNDNQPISNKVRSAASNLTKSLLCRQIDIDSIVNDIVMSQCIDLSMYGERCYEDIEQEKFIRLIIGPQNKGDVIILTVEMLGKSCWLRTVKKIPRNRFGAFAYLVQREKIEFNVTKSLADEFEYNKVKDLASVFKDKDNGEEADYIFQLEHIDENGRQRLYLNSNQVSEEQLITIIDMVN